MDEEDELMKAIVIMVLQLMVLRLMLWMLLLMMIVAVQLLVPAVLRWLAVSVDPGL